MQNLTSPERRTCLEGLSSNGKFVHQTRVQRWGEAHCLLCHSYSSNLGGKNPWVDSWAKTHWGWCLFMDLIILFKQELPKSCLWCLWNGYLALVVSTSYVLLFPDIEKKDFSCQIRLLLKGDHVWISFHVMESLCIDTVLREHEATHWFISPTWGGNQCGKKARLAFLSKDVLGLVSFQWF